MKIYQVRADCVSDEGACGLFESPWFVLREFAVAFERKILDSREIVIREHGLYNDVEEESDRVNMAGGDYAEDGQPLTSAWIADDGHFKDTIIIEREVLETCPNLGFQSEYFWCVHEGI